MEVKSRSSYGYKLESQIQEAYGRVLYTMTSHDKQAKDLKKKDNTVKIIQIILSALTTGSFIGSVIYDKQLASIVGAILSFVLLIFNLYAKNFKLIEEAKEHENAANMLWKVREEYVSLLVDFQNIEEEQIISKRDELQDRTHKIYSSTPRTNEKSYKRAQKAIKEEEEQSFSKKELNDILPEALRR